MAYEAGKKEGARRALALLLNPAVPGLVRVSYLTFGGGTVPKVSAVYCSKGPDGVYREETVSPVL